MEGRFPNAQRTDRAGIESSSWNYSLIVGSLALESHFIISQQIQIAKQIQRATVNHFLFFDKARDFLTNDVPDNHYQYVDDFLW